LLVDGLLLGLDVGRFVGKLVMGVFVIGCLVGALVDGLPVFGGKDGLSVTGFELEGRWLGA
jgi:hypothetical protein